MDEKYIPADGVPQDVRWQFGKNAASIRFVGKAEEFIAACDDAVKIAKLQEAITKIKSGELVLTVWTTPQEFLDKTNW